jgi:pimeloyl-ACP methyl ester carboxylesterase
VLALHGWLDNAASFDAVAPLLPELRLVALDLPGHGHSGHRPPGVHYHFIDYIHDVVAAADALGWERFALLGHSLGGAIASFVAGVVPERILRLALIEALGPLSMKPDVNPAATQKALEQMGALDSKPLPVYADLREASGLRAVASGFSPAIATLLTIRNVKPVAGGLTWRSDPRLLFKSPLYLTEEQVLAYLVRIEAPCLVICAEHGYLRRRANMAQRYARVPALELKTMPGGHHLHLENPRAVAEVLGEFLGRDRARP